MTIKASIPHRILLVDDNADAGIMLSMVLKLLGHEVVTARTGADGLAEAKDFRPDVAILDIGMPGMDGHELCRRLRAEPGGTSIRMIALTGWGSEVDRQRTRAAGFDVHLVKPVDRETLSKALDP